MNFPVEWTRPNLVTSFESKWVELDRGKHPDAILACITVFEAEYNHEWVNAFESLEFWIEQNDSFPRLSSHYHAIIIIS